MVDRVLSNMDFAENAGVQFSDTGEPFLLSSLPEEICKRLAVVGLHRVLRDAGLSCKNGEDKVSVRTGLFSELTGGNWPFGIRRVREPSEPKPLAEDSLFEALRFIAKQHGYEYTREQFEADGYTGRNGVAWTPETKEKRTEAAARLDVRTAKAFLKAQRKLSEPEQETEAAVA